MLFEDIVYGPIRSRRLGISLGINLMPQHAKLCSFDCVYCECGFNTPTLHPSLPTRQEVSESLKAKLEEMQAHAEPMPDVITFSGNGEPTMHPAFADIIADTCALRDAYCPSAKVSVLSNSTQLHRADVREALLLCDNRILKLDSGLTPTMRLIDQPVNSELTVDDIMGYLGLFEGHFTLQTCFLRGDVLLPNPNRPDSYLLGHIDNTTPEEREAWYAMVRRLRPEHVMIYVIDRKTPVETLEKIDANTMHSIAAPLIAEGFDVHVSA